MSLRVKCAKCGNVEKVVGILPISWKCPECKHVNDGFNSIYRGVE